MAHASNRDLPETKVEFVSTRTPGSVHIVNEVHVNGSRVCVMEDGIDIEYGSSVPTVVTLKLIASEVHFRSSSSTEEPSAPLVDAIKVGGAVHFEHVHEAMKDGGAHNA